MATSRLVRVLVNTSDDGFSLIEVVVSLLVVAVALFGVARLFAVAIQDAFGARSQTSASILAAQRMEQLRALTWGTDTTAARLPASDIVTNLSVTPATSLGSGLNPSPVSSLDSNTVGFVDYLDKRGAWVGTGVTPPASTMFVRRWRILPLPLDPDNTLILQVLVTTAQRERSLTAANSPRRRLPNDALLTTLKTRKAN